MRQSIPLPSGSPRNELQPHGLPHSACVTPFLSSPSAIALMIVARFSLYSPVVAISEHCLQVHIKSGGHCWLLNNHYC